MSSSKNFGILMLMMVLIVGVISPSVAAEEEPGFFCNYLNLLCPEEETSFSVNGADDVADANLGIVQGLQHINDDPLYDCKVTLDGVGIDSKEKITIIDEKGKEKVVKTKKLEKEVFKFEKKDLDKNFKYKCGDASDEFILSDILVRNESGNTIYSELYKEGVVEEGYELWVRNGKFGANLTNTTPATRSYRFWSEDYVTKLSSTGRVAFSLGNDLHIVNDEDICSQTSEIYGAHLDVDGNTVIGWHTVGASCKRSVWKEWSHNETLIEGEREYEIEHFTYYAEIEFFGNETDPTFDISPEGTNLFLQDARWEPKNYTHASIVNNSMIGYWNAENDQNITGGTVYDWTDNDDDGTLNGNAHIGEGIIGQHSFVFDGTGDYITVPDNDNLTIGTGDWSMAAWVYVASVSSYDGIVTSGPWNSGADNFNLVTHAAGNRYWLSVSTGSGWWINLQTTAGSLVQDEWQHIAVTLDRDGAQTIYINGASAASQSTTNTNDLDTSAVWNFGEQITYGDLDGKMDEIMFFNKSLASGEVSAIYNNQSSKFSEFSNTSLKSIKIPSGPDNRAEITFLDSYIPSGTNATANVGGWWEGLGYTSPSDNSVAAHYPLDHNFEAYKGSANGTLTSTTDVSGEFAGALDFDGSTSYGYADITDGSINFGDGTNDEPFSVSFWYNSTSSQAANLVGNFYKSGSNNGIYPSWGVLMQGGSGEFEFWLCDSGSICLERQLDITKFSPHDGLIHNVVWTYDGRGGSNADEGLKVYIDGLEYPTQPDFTHPSYVAMSNLGGDFYIGRRKDGANDYNGYLDDIIIFNKTLAQEEIAENYVKGFLDLDFQGSAQAISNSVSTGIAFNDSSEKIVPLVTYDTGEYQFSSPWVDMSFVNITLYEAASPPVPEVTNLDETPTSPATYAPGQNYTFNAIVTSLDTITNVTLYIDGVNHTASNISSTYEVILSDLPAGSYPYTWYALDSLGGINDSENGTYVIDKAERTLELLLNGQDSNISVINGSEVNITGSLTTGALDGQNLSILVNGTLYQTEPNTSITNLTSFSLGTWQINLTIPETANYTGIVEFKTLTVKQESIINTTVDGRDGPIYRNTNTTFEIITERLVPATGAVENRVNGSLLNSGSSPLSYNYNFIYSGTYNVTGSNLESSTHLAGSDTVFVYIIDDDDNPSVVPISPNNESYGAYSTVTISANMTDLFDIEIANFSLKNPNNESNNYTLTNIGGDTYSFDYDTAAGPIGQYEVTFYAYDTSDRLNDSEKAYFLVNESAPVVTEATLIATDHPLNLTTANLTLTYNSTDSQNDSIYYSTDYRVANISNNLLYLSFDEYIQSDIVLDLSSNENNATLVNGYNVTSGIIGNAIGLNGINQSIDIGSAFSDLSEINGSLNLWINPAHTLQAGISENVTFFSQWHRYQLYYISSGKLVFRTDDDYTYHTLTLPDNQWTQLSAVYSYETGSKYHKVFVDGDLVAESNLSGASAQFNTDNLHLGVKFDNNGYAEYFNGSIDNVRVYNYTLSDEQINTMFIEENSTNQGYTTVVSQETTVGEVWSACVTASDGKLSDELCSNTVEIDEIIPVVLVEDLIELPASPATYAEGQQYIFNATVNSTEATDTVLLTFDGENFSASGVGGEYTVTIENLSAGTYTYTWFANDTLGNINYTQGGNYTVNLASPSLGISLIPSPSVLQGTETNASGTDCPSQITCTLYRDGTPVSNPDIQTLSLGNYTYTYNTTGNENYTNFSTSSILQITLGSAPNVTNLTEFPTSPTIYEPGKNYQFNATVTSEGTLDTVMLTFDGSNYSTTSDGSTYYVNLTDLTAGVYAYTWFANRTTGATNYSEGGSYTISKANGECNLTSDSPITYPSNITVNAACNFPGLVLYRDGNNVTSENGIPTELGAGTYNYTVNISANSNYTSAVNYTEVIVNQANTVLSINVSPSANVTEGVETTVLGENCPSQITCTLYREGSPVSNPDVQNLSPGNYTYIYNTTGNQNYTENSTTILLQINPIPAPNVTDLIEFPTDPATYAEGQQYQFNATITSEGTLDAVILTFDGINYSATSDGSTYYVNLSDLTAGVYAYTWFANITTGATNYSEGGTYTINKDVPVLSINVEPGTSVASGVTTNTTGLNCPSEITCNLYLNSTLVGNPDVQSLPYGNHTYKFNTTGNENYTSASISQIVEVGAAPEFEYEIIEIGEIFVRVSWN